MNDQPIGELLIDISGYRFTGGIERSGMTDKMSQDKHYMALALEQAAIALQNDEVPVGAVAVADGRVIGKGHNLKEAEKDPTAHAEIIALREASSSLGRWRLSDVTLYVTLEPCVMCAGAMIQARLGRLVFGVADPKGGACGSEYNIVQDSRLNHLVSVTAGILRDEAAFLLQEFFTMLRCGEARRGAVPNLL
jgi:tRNA(Arg) A34 adenosine deaminase TadA